MADQREGGIAWTDQTWNPVRGCTRVSEGCRNCYAETVAARFSGPGKPYAGLINAKTGAWNGKVKLVREHLEDPKRWKRRRRVFVNSMSDLFHEAIPSDFIDEIFNVMFCASEHTFQVLTKRPERMRDYVLARELKNYPIPNVHLGVSVENQQAADERIPFLLETPAAVRFLSVEPLLGPVNLDNGDTSWLTCTRRCSDDGREHRCESHWEFGRCFHGIDWVIVGGESGREARPCDVAWIRSVVEQCREAAVACFVKQLGTNIRTNGITFPGEHWPDGSKLTDDGRGGFRVKPVFWGSHPKADLLEQMPQDLRVREFPDARA